MKRALLWLGPLACLALACLYAYAWFNRDPLVVAFDRIEVGMKCEEVDAIIGRRPNEVLHADDSCFTVAYKGERDEFLVRVTREDGRVVETGVYRLRKTTFDKLCDLLRNPSSLWNSGPPPPPPTTPAGGNPRDYDVGYVNEPAGR
jgi:hypothetical protein